jgi:predicted CXXCH cytochrome family protein
MRRFRHDSQGMGGFYTIKFAVIAVFLVLQLASPACAAPAKGLVTLISPPDNSVLEGPLLSLAMRVQLGAVDDLQVSVNNRKLSLPKKQYQKFNVCFDGIGLSFGLNNIKVVGRKEGKVVEETTVHVYFRSDLSAEASSAPEGFTPYLFHSYAQEKVCMPCHQLDFSGYDGGPTPAEKSPCYQCHKKILRSYGSEHGPAAVWSCLACHDQKATPKLSVPKPDSKMCYNCHENSWTSMKFGHGPTSAGSCATCHDPHASDYPFFLRAPAGVLCLGCHEDILLKPHVTAGFSNAGHPVRRNTDPYHPNREFNCVSCHNPHAGASSTFLKNYDGTSDIGVFCRTCHSM